MEFGIKARDIMNRNFPLLDSSLNIERCIRNLDNRYEGCIILSNGFIKSIITYDDLLRVFFLRRKRDLKLSEIKTERNFRIISEDTDLFDVIKLMKEGADFVVVKGKNEYGLITKKEIVEINQFLFDKLERQVELV